MAASFSSPPRDKGFAGTANRAVAAVAVPLRLSAEIRVYLDLDELQIMLKCFGAFLPFYGRLLSCQGLLQNLSFSLFMAAKRTFCIAIHGHRPVWARPAIIFMLFTAATSTLFGVYIIVANNVRPVFANFGVNKVGALRFRFAARQHRLRWHCVPVRAHCTLKP